MSFNNSLIDTFEKSGDVDYGGETNFMGERGDSLSLCARAKVMRESGEE